jgi:predicted secreted protein
MTTVADIGHGATFTRETSTPGTYAALGELIDPGSLSRSRDTVDATHSGSTDGYREYISGLRDAGEFTCVIALEPSASASSAHATLTTDFDSNSSKNYRFTFPSGVYWTFAAFITSIEEAVPLDDRMTLSLTFKRSGKPTIT